MRKQLANFCPTTESELGTAQDQLANCITHRLAHKLQEQASEAAATVLNIEQCRLWLTDNAWEIHFFRLNSESVQLLGSILQNLIQTYRVRCTFVQRLMLKSMLTRVPASFCINALNLGLKCNNYEVIIYLSNIWADWSRVWQPVWFRKCAQRYLRLRGTMPQLFSYVMAMG